MTLKINNVNKTYPNGVQAVKNLSLDINRGEVFGLVGPNGAGKSTLLKLICGLLKADNGSILYENADITGNPQLAAEYVGLMPDPLGVYTDITAKDYLEFFARVFAIPESEQAGRITAVVDELELGPWLEEEVETLSAGWQRRLALGRILLADMPVLLLDEPAAGLDVSARKELLLLVRKLAAKNRAIVISSHILPELEDLADRFGIIDEGEWKEISPDKVFFNHKDMAVGLGVGMIMIRCSEPDLVCKELTDSGFDVELRDSSVQVKVPEGDDQIAECITQICAKSYKVYDVHRINAGLSDVVLNVLEKDKETS